MSSQRAGAGRYSALIIGLTLVLGGVATFGTFLVAAGEHLTAQAAILASASVALFIAGFVLLTRSARRRGGVLDAEPTPAERVTYDAEHPTHFLPAWQGDRPAGAQIDNRGRRRPGGHRE
jgi:hypothetical protein